jgi:hypothetical protein
MLEKAWSILGETLPEMMPSLILTLLLIIAKLVEPRVALMLYICAFGLLLWVAGRERCMVYVAQCLGYDAELSKDAIKLHPSL